MRILGRDGRTRIVRLVELDPPLLVTVTRRFVTLVACVGLALPITPTKPPPLVESAQPPGKLEAEKAMGKRLMFCAPPLVLVTVTTIPFMLLVAPYWNGKLFEATPNAGIAGKTSRLILLLVVAPPALDAVMTMSGKLPAVVGLVLRMTKLVPTKALVKPGGKLEAPQVTEKSFVARFAVLVRVKTRALGLLEPNWARLVVTEKSGAEGMELRTRLVKAPPPAFLTRIFKLKMPACRFVPPTIPLVGLIEIPKGPLSRAKLFAKPAAKPGALESTRI